MKNRKIRIGDDVFVRNPQRFLPDFTCITGIVIALRKRGQYASIEGSTGKMGGGGYNLQATFKVEDLGVRIGTPISRISTQPNQSGYAEWLRISRSWGY